MFLLTRFAILYIALLGGFLQASPREKTGQVWEIRDPRVVTGQNVSPSILQPMVDKLLLETTGTNSLTQAWNSLVEPGQVVGIKIAANSAPLISTRPELVSAVIDSMLRGGIKPGQILVFDRDARFLQRYKPLPAGVRLKATQHGAGYDPDATVRAPVMGRLIWGDHEFMPSPILLPGDATEPEQLSNTSHWSSIVTREIDVMINVSVLMERPGIGVAGAMFNAIIPNLDNWRRFVRGSRPGSAYLAQLYPELPIPVVLHIVDALIVQYAGGPEPHPNYAHRHRTLLAGFDPVALDARGLMAIEAFREEALLPSVVETAAYLQVAGRMGLGEPDPDRLQIHTISP